METIELLTKFDKAAIVVKQFYLDVMLSSLNNPDLYESYKDFVKAQEFDNNNIAKIIDGNPRALFDVFDKNNVFIETNIDISNINSPRFSFSINKEDGGIRYENRKECDRVALEKAFELLNNIL